jgi:prevent-host-death family protein
MIRDLKRAGVLVQTLDPHRVFCLMPTVTIHDAKTKLSKLIRRVEAGEEIIIARGDTPVATLQDYKSADIAARRLAGRWNS